MLILSRSKLPTKEYRTGRDFIVISDMESKEVVGRVGVADVRGDMVRLLFDGFDGFRIDREEVRNKEDYHG